MKLQISVGSILDYVTSKIIHKRLWQGADQYREASPSALEPLEPRLLFSASPVAHDDIFLGTVNEGILVNDMLLNDTDGDGDTLSIDSITVGPASGTVDYDALNDTYTYNPNPGFAGKDTFSYRVTDGALTADGVVEVFVSTDIDATGWDLILPSTTTDYGVLGATSKQSLAVFGPNARTLSLVDFTENETPLGEKLENPFSPYLNDQVGAVTAAATMGAGRVVVIPDTQFTDGNLFDAFWVDRTDPNNPVDHPEINNDELINRIISWLGKAPEVPGTPLIDTIRPLRIVTNDLEVKNYFDAKLFPNVIHATTELALRDALADTVSPADIYFGTDGFTESSTFDALEKFVLDGGGLVSGNNDLDTLSVSNSIIRPAGILVSENPSTQTLGHSQTTAIPTQWSREFDDIFDAISTFDNVYGRYVFYQHSGGVWNNFGELYGNHVPPNQVPPSAIANGFVADSGWGEDAVVAAATLVTSHMWAMAESLPQYDTLRATFSSYLGQLDATDVEDVKGLPTIRDLMAVGLTRLESENNRLATPDEVQKSAVVDALLGHPVLPETPRVTNYEVQLDWSKYLLQPMGLHAAPGESLEIDFSNAMGLVDKGFHIWINSPQSSQILVQDPALNTIPKLARSFEISSANLDAANKLKIGDAYGGPLYFETEFEGDDRQVASGPFHAGTDPATGETISWENRVGQEPTAWVETNETFAARYGLDINEPKLTVTVSGGAVEMRYFKLGEHTQEDWDGDGTNPGMKDLPGHTTILEIPAGDYSYILPSREIEAWGDGDIEYFTFMSMWTNAAEQQIRPLGLDSGEIRSQMAPSLIYFDRPGSDNPNPDGTGNLQSGAMRIRSSVISELPNNNAINWHKLGHVYEGFQLGNFNPSTGTHASTDWLKGGNWDAMGVLKPFNFYESFTSLTSNEFPLFMGGTDFGEHNGMEVWRQVNRGRYLDYYRTFTFNPKNEPDYPVAMTKRDPAVGAGDFARRIFDLTGYDTTDAFAAYGVNIDSATAAIIGSGLPWAPIASSYLGRGEHIKMFPDTTLEIDLAANTGYIPLDGTGWKLTNGQDISIAEPVITTLLGGTIEDLGGGIYKYTPPVGVTGQDSFEYTATHPDNGYAVTFNVPIKIYQAHTAPADLNELDQLAQHLDRGFLTEKFGDDLNIPNVEYITHINSQNSATTRWRGYLDITAETAGLHNFWLSSQADGAYLKLAYGGTALENIDPANAQTLISLTPATVDNFHRQWESTNVSASINLPVGRYYIEAMKEGNHNLSIGWSQGTLGEMPDEIIPSDMIIPFAAPRVLVANNDIASTPLNKKTTINVLANDSDPFAVANDTSNLRVFSLVGSGNGTVEFVDADALGYGTQVAYTPKPGFVGTDYFYYAIKHKSSPNEMPQMARVTVHVGQSDADTLAPTASSSTIAFVVEDKQISMTAPTGSDASIVEYYFEETSGNPGGADSGWQTSNTYTNTGLQPSTTYSYTVRMRDLMSNSSQSTASQSATTLAISNHTPTFTSQYIVLADAVSDSAYTGSSLASYASDTDPADALTFYKLPYSGPSWLVVDPITGDLSGTPTTSDIGLNSWTIRIDDGNGAYNTATLYLLVQQNSVISDIGTDDLILHHNYNELAAETIAADSSGNGHQGVIGSSSAPPVFDGNGNLVFTGSGIWIGSTGLINNSVIPQRTMAAQFNVTDASLTTPQFLFKAGFSGSGWNMYIMGGRIYGGGIVGGVLNYVDAPITNGAHTAAITYDTTANNIALYIDGVLVDTTASAPAVPAQGGQVSAGSSNTKTRLHTGLTPGADTGFIGTINDFRLYNRAVPADEISIWHHFVSGTTPPPNTLPNFITSPINWPAITEGELFTGTIGNLGNDPDGHPLTYSIGSGPDWLTMQPDGTLSGTPSGLHLGDNSWHVLVRDSQNGFGVAQLNMTVNARPNTAPVFSPESTPAIQGNKVIVGAAYSGTLSNTASDVDLDALTYSKAPTDPDWLQVAKDGTLSGVPSLSDVGINTFNILVDDGRGGTASTELKINVLAASAWDEIVFDDFEAGWGNYTSGGWRAVHYTYSGTGPNYAPAGNGAINVEDNSHINSHFSLTDGIDVSSLYQQIKVEFSYQTIGFADGEDFWVQYHDGASWETVAAYVTDSVSLPNGVVHSATVIIDKANHIFPTDMKIRFRADASGANDDVYIDNIKISGFTTVPPNNLPVAANDAATTTENTPIVIDPLTNSDTDLDGDTLSIIAVDTSLGYGGTVVIDPGGTTITYEPAPNFSGVDSFTYTVSDGQGGTDIGTVNVTVIDSVGAPNTAPTLVTPIPDVMVDQGAANTVIDLAAAFTDDVAVTSFAVVGTPTLANATINGTSLTLDYAPNLAGTENITIRAFDAEGLFVDDTFSLMVNAAAGPIPVAHWKLDDGSGTIAADASGNANHGTVNDATWIAGTDGGALSFDGINDAVNIPALNLNSNTVTMTAWIRRSGNQQDFDTIIYTQNATSVAGIMIQQNNTLRYNWDRNTWDWDSGLVVPDNQWVFVALAVEPTKATMYMHDGTSMQSATNIEPHAVEEFNGTLTLGYNSIVSGREFTGAIDDPRVYATTLNATEVTALFDSYGGAPNTAPTVVTPIPDVTVDQGAANTVIDLAAAFTDDVAVTSFAVVGTPTLANATINGTSLTLDYAPNLAGTENITIRAFDAEGLFVDDTFSLTVNVVLPTVTLAAIDASAAEPADTGTFRVTRTGDTASALTVNYTIAGTAIGGSDYTSLTGSVTIAAGLATADITVAPIDDSLIEGAETVELTLSAAAAYTVGAPSTDTVTITSDDVALPTPTNRWSFNGNANDSAGTVNGILTGGASAGSTTSVEGQGLLLDGIDDYVNIDNAGLEDAFTNYSVSLWFRPSDIIGTEVLYEEGGDWNGFALRMNGSNLEAVVASGQVQSAIVTQPGITADTWHFATVTFEAGILSLYLDGSASPAVTNTGFANIPAHGDAANIGRQATSSAFGGVAGNYFAGSIDELRVFDGQALSAAQVQLLADEYSPGNVLPTVTLAAIDASAAEPADTGTFRVTRTGDTASALTVNYTIAGTAIGGSDYTSLTGSVTIAAGLATADITVAPIDDSLIEGAETVELTLSAAAAYTVGAPSTDTVTITSDDVSSTTYQAESFTAQSGTSVTSNHAGFNGTGYVDYGGNGTWAEWNNIDGTSGGTRTLVLRYANGSAGNRQSEIVVNGVFVGNITFAPTGSWTTWATVSIDIPLNPGFNTIRVAANTGSGGPNLDEITA